MKTGITVDGGGILGIGSVCLLRELNYDNEDFLAGTSVGSIIVALRAIGLSWERVYNIFKTECVSIFKKPSILWSINPFKPKYDNDVLKKMLKKYLGDMKMCDLRIPTFITTSDFSCGKPKVYDNTDDIYVRDVVLQSTAAPTYFPPVNNRFADGGLWANNPSLVGLTGYVDKYGEDIDNIRILSIGTNGDFYRGIKIHENLSLLQWASKIIDFELYCTEDSITFYCNKILKNRYLRIEPRLHKDYPLDAVDAVDDYEKIWFDYWNYNKKKIISWIENK